METTDETALSARERVLRAASAAFAEHGFANTSLNDIARRIGIKKSSLYYHFESKDEILSTLVYPLLDSIDEFLDVAEAGHPQSPRYHLANYAKILQGSPSTVRILGAETDTWKRAPLRERITSHQRRLIRLLVGQEQDAERVFRTHMALGLLQRGLFTGRAELLPSEVISLTDDQRGQLTVQIAMEILDGADRYIT